MSTSTEQLCIELAGRRLDCSVLRSSRRTLGITVFPDGRLLASAPLDSEISKVEAKLIKRGSWILKTLREFERFRPRTPKRTFEPGETHLFLGHQYRLKVRNGLRSVVERDRDYIWVSYPHKSATTEKTEAVLSDWYKRQARVHLIDRLTVCMKRFPEIHTNPRLSVRALTRRWGSMSAQGDHMILNRRLVEAPIDCIDYVIIHELCHVLEHHHGSNFFILLDQKLPNWRKTKARLENFMV